MMKSKIGKTLVLFIFVYLIYVLSSGLWQLYKAGGRVEEARSRLVEERQKNEELKKKLSEVKSDDFIEREAREELNMQKPGEVVVILPEIDLKGLDESQKNAEKSTKNWQKWFQLFK